MRIRELSDRTGISIPTIKYYIREGLLPPGKRTAPTQAVYDESHIDRLELIRALREGAGLSIATLSQVFEVMASADDSATTEYLRVAVGALTPPVEIPEEDEDDYEVAADMVHGLLDELGWNADPSSPPAAELGKALVHVRRHLVGLIDEPEDLLPYAHAARALADYEIADSYDPAGRPDDALRLAVLGTVLFEPVLLAIRKLAHVDRIRTLSSG